MKNDWGNGEVSPQSSHLEICLHASHRIGQSKTRVLPHWGSVSVKIPTANLFGEAEDVLWISAAGQDLRTIRADGFTALHSAALVSLLKLDHLAEEQYLNSLYCSRVEANAPLPPPEALIHAVIPSRYVFHIYPEALLVIANSTSWKERLEQVYQQALLVIDGTPTNFSSAKAIPPALIPWPSAMLEGIYLPDKGLFVFSDDGREAYARTLSLVSRAEGYLQSRQAWSVKPAEFPLPERPLRQELASLRKAAAELAGYPALLCMHPDLMNQGSHLLPELPAFFQKGAVTPAQAAMMQPLPVVKQDFEANIDHYRAGGEGLNPPSPAILDAELGMLTISRTAMEARLLADVCLQASRVLARAVALGDYQPHFQPEIQKRETPGNEMLRQGAAVQAEMFAGEVALVTGGASGIGKACVESLLRRGAAVVSMDINPVVKTLYDRPDYLGFECDLTDETAVIQGFEAAARAFGGLDMLVLNAGIFPPGIRIEALDLASWQKAMRINLDSYLIVMREAYPLLKYSLRGGRVVLNASKNVLAPGAGAAAYSSSKAAVTQLARVAALEWGKDRIRINIIHPDAVFDTGIWTEEVLQARAAHYGLTLQQYKTRNLLGVELNSHYVGELVAEMLGPLFEKITGAQIPVDGGSDRII